ncbi:MAG: hypothetical protein A4E71_02159 [Smithella sp. PtaU1.Bin162]|nr:MAG: hypothetical protein A4E71_02159 [Smithella sp. PtaU1.Bin162]
MPKWGKILLLIIVCTLIASCASVNSFFTENWGKMRPDGAAKESFETYQVRPDYNYYISGSDVYPFAILGLHKTCMLESDLWKKISPTPEKMKELVLDMQSKALDMGQKQFGFAVFDNKEKQIGIWYSILSATAPVEMKGEGKVTIYTPDPDTYDKDELKMGTKKH